MSRTYVLLVGDILKAERLAFPLHFSNLLLGLALEHLVSLLVLSDVDESENLIHDQVQNESAQHSHDSVVVCGRLGAFEELGASDLANTVADEDPTGRNRPLGATGDVGRKEAKDNHEADGVSAEKPNSDQTAPFIVEVELVDQAGTNDLSNFCISDCSLSRPGNSGLTGGIMATVPICSLELEILLVKKPALS